LLWKQLKNSGQVPSPRSGHSLSYIGGFNYLLFGGIDHNKKNGKITPLGDVYTMKIGQSKPL